MKLIKLIFTKFFWINIVLAMLFISAGIWITFTALDSYTKHGETITVPDLRGLTLKQVKIYLNKKQLEYAVIDSAFTVDEPPTTVLDQDPKAASKVKENRKIYLTINATQPPKVKMPDLIDKSLRQASIELESWSLKVGELSYKPDLAQNAVLDQLYNDSTIAPGALLPKGSVVDLVLGDGFGNTTIEVPNLSGLTLEEAKWSLIASSLNLGAVVYDETVEDSTEAVIYSQIPEFVEENPRTLNMGESIDVFLTKELPESVQGHIDTTDNEAIIDEFIEDAD
ncbi:MAG: PASTA domain-containing protein [Chitinophagales bacterium]